MSFAVPKINPDSYDWLAQQDPNTLPAEHFIMCAEDYIRHNVEQGIPADQFMPVDRFFKPGDLQTLCDVVSWWPTHPDCPVQAPTPATVLTLIRNRDPSQEPVTFDGALKLFTSRVQAWLKDSGHDPNNPNESKRERDNRLAAERMRKMRRLRAEVDITDPDEMNLLRALRTAKDNLAACKKYVRDQEAAAKLAYDAAVAQAKLARSATVSAAQAWVNPTHQKVLEAEAALEAYRASK